MATDARGALSTNLRPLTHEFYQLHREDPDYDGLSLREVHQICKATLVFLKEMLGNDSLPTIHIKHFGKFTVYEGKIRNKLAENEGLFKAGRRNEKDYLELRQKYNHFLHLISTKEESPSQGFVLIDDVEKVKKVRATERARNKYKTNK